MGWLFERPSADVANHWLALLSLALFAAGIVATAVISTRPSLPPFRGRNTQKFVAKACTIVGWICGVGMFFGIIRVLQIDPATLGRPIWIVLCWVALVAAIGYLIYLSPADRVRRKLNDERLRQRQGLKPPRKRSAAKASRSGKQMNKIPADPAS